MNLNDLTLGQIREIQNLSLVTGAPRANTGMLNLLDKNCIVRTVTMIYTGKLIKITDSEVVLENCSWIPETDRYMKFVAEGAVKECEPFPEGLPVYINRGALLDVCELKKELPRSQK